MNDTPETNENDKTIPPSTPVTPKLRSDATTRGLVETSKRRIGFATMDVEKRLELARRGGKTAHAKGVAHEFTRETARAAALKGVEARAAKKEGEAP